MESDIDYNPNSSNQVTLSNGVFKGCTSSLGGVIYAKNDDKNLHLQVKITDSTFEYNFAQDAGVLYWDAKNQSLSAGNLDIRYNEALHANSFAYFKNSGNNSIILDRITA
jgi:hypothetical protein